jgi:DNA-binding CsgD family transcriptional regulator
MREPDARPTSPSALFRPVDGRVLDVCGRLAEDASAAGIAGALLTLFGADDIIYNTLDVGSGTAHVLHGERADEDPALGTTLAAVGATHPVVLSYLSGRGGLSPRRLSDVTTSARWYATPAWSEMFRPLGGRHQLSLVVGLSPTVGSGWVLTRERRDFGFTDLDRAAALLPALVAVSRAHGELSLAASGDTALLSPREQQILRLVGDGYTAYSIGLRVGISTFTVRKHLQNAYAKIGVSDRLGAVNEARRRGLLLDTNPHSANPAPARNPRDSA